MEELWDGEVVDPEHALWKLVGRLWDGGAVGWRSSRPRARPLEAEAEHASPALALQAQVGRANSHVNRALISTSRGGWPHAPSAEPQRHLGGGVGLGVLHRQTNVCKRYIVDGGAVGWRSCGMEN